MPSIASAPDDVRRKACVGLVSNPDRSICLLTVHRPAGAHCQTNKENER